MCGRFALFASKEAIAQRFQLPDTPFLEARYNIAPSQTVGAVRATETAREMRFIQWGVIPSWSSNPTMGYKLINARVETVRSALKERRCLIPASAFYEWGGGNGRCKQPYCIRLHDEKLFAFAGMWERWQRPQAEAIEFCTLLTTEANEVMRPIHDRMPVILDAESENEWLDPLSAPDSLRALLMPFPADQMQAFAVSYYVSNTRNQGPQCIEPAIA
jgi:putative SOS response-associated peptidase YedK